jgi:hypothetical protein
VATSNPRTTPCTARACESWRRRPAHLHADFRFAFWVKDSKVSIQIAEVTAFAWRSPADLPTARLAAGVAAV